MDGSVNLREAIRATITKHMENKGVDTSFDDDTDLFSAGALNSFDAVSIIADLEATLETDVTLTGDEDFVMSVASIAKLFPQLA